MSSLKTFILPILVCIIIAVVCVADAGKPAKNSTFNYNKDDGPLLILTYCSFKSTLKRHHFHKNKCIRRNTESYDTYCLGSGFKVKSCLRLRKRLKHFHPEPIKPRLEQARMLDVKNYTKHVCGFELYDTERYICCNGIVIKANPSHHQCCGRVLVNMSRHICCPSENIYTRMSDEQDCCEDKLYNTTTQRCLSGQIIEHNETYVDKVGSESTTVDFVQMYVSNEPTVDLEERNPDLEAKEKFGFSLGQILAFVCTCIVIFTVTGIALVYHKGRKITTCKSVKENQPPPSSQSDFKSDSQNMVPSNQTGDSICCNQNSIRNKSLIASETDCLNIDGYVLIKRMGLRNYDETDDRSIKYNSFSEQRNPSDESLHSTITCTLRMEDLIKDSTTNSKNLSENLLKDSSTQTPTQKQTNRRDMFDNPFKFSCVLNKQNLHVELQNSDAKMTISEQDVEQKEIEVHASSHTCVPDIRKKMNIKDEGNIISPCMEYDLPGVIQLKDYAVIEMKLTCNTSEGVKIWRYSLEEKSKSHVTVEVPVVQTTETDFDTFCILRGNRAYVYTKVFSTYVCTKHNDGEEIDIELWGVLYARMQIISDKTILHLTLYIVESLYNEIKDYTKHLDDEEWNNYSSRRIAHEKVQLPPSVNDKDILETELTITNTEQWDFIKDPGNSSDSSVYARYTHELCGICCQNRSVESAKSTWDLQDKGDQRPGIFQGHVYIKTGNDRRRKPVITVTQEVKRPAQMKVRGECSKTPLCSYDQRRPDFPHKELDSQSYPISGSNVGMIFDNDNQSGI